MRFGDYVMSSANRRASREVFQAADHRNGPDIVDQCRKALPLFRVDARRSRPSTKRRRGDMCERAATVPPCVWSGRWVDVKAGRL